MIPPKTQNQHFLLHDKKWKFSVKICFFLWWFQNLICFALALPVSEIRPFCAKNAELALFSRSHFQKIFNQIRFFPLVIPNFNLFRSISYGFWNFKFAKYLSSLLKYPMWSQICVRFALSLTVFEITTENVYLFNRLFGYWSVLVKSKICTYIQWIIP